MHHRRNAVQNRVCPRAYSTRLVRKAVLRGYRCSRDQNCYPTSSSPSLEHNATLCWTLPSTISAIAVSFVLNDILELIYSAKYLLIPGFREDRRHPTRLENYQRLTAHRSLDHACNAQRRTSTSSLGLRLTWIS
jgi:hypothetical protein